MRVCDGCFEQESEARPLALYNVTISHAFAYGARRPKKMRTLYCKACAEVARDEIGARPGVAGDILAVASL
jgi:hypothetical protein